MAKSRGILYTGEMIRALLAKRKRMTRRTRGLDQINEAPDEWTLDGRVLATVEADRARVGSFCFADRRGGESVYLRCPYGEPGDRLWARETLRLDDEGDWRYGADGAPLELDEGDPRASAAISWAYHNDHDLCVSIHMPRWASRLVHEITEVRAERCHDISEADAEAEGVNPDTTDLAGYAPHKSAFAYLWQTLNGKRGHGWQRNEWVWVISYKPVDATPHLEGAR